MRNCVRILVVLALALMSVASLGGVATAAVGTITGKVFESDGTSNIQGATVSAYQGGYLVDSVVTGTGGYVLTVEEGTYQLVARGPGLFDQDYPTPVSTGTANVNFTMTRGKCIQGTVYNENSTEPIWVARVRAFDSVSGAEVEWTYTDNTGKYSITLVSGNYTVDAEKGGWVTEYYDNKTTKGTANVVAVGSSDNTTGINFSLAKSGFISGRMLEADSGDPIPSGNITAYNPASVFVLAGRPSDNGDYTLNLTAAGGPYKILAQAPGYVPQWWDGIQFKPETGNPRVTPYWDNATAVAVVDGLESPGIAFNMLPVQAVATSAATLVGTENATLNGDLTSMGARAADASPSVNVYFRWGTDTGYTGGNTTAVPHTTTGAFSANLASLTPNVTYHFQAVAVGYLTTYGADMTFTTTQLGAPVVTTEAASAVTSTGATLNGNLTSLGTAANVTLSFEYGTTISYGTTTTGVVQAATGAFTAALTGLAPNTGYHFRAKAVGDGDPAYGADQLFTTTASPPTAVTDNATSVGTASAVLNGRLTSLGTATSIVVSFEWKVTGGTYATTTPTQTLTAPGAFTFNLTNLTDGMTYVFRAKAVGHGAAAYGAETNFTTTAIDRTGPVLSALDAGDPGSSGATVTWTTNEAATSQVEYGLTEEYGEITDEDTSLVTSHSVELTGLEGGKTYYYRVVSKDAAGNATTSEGSTFETESGGGGMPVWGWVLVGLAAVGLVGGGAFFFLKGRAAPPAP